MMAFQFRRGQPVGDEARQLFDHQLLRAPLGAGYRSADRRLRAANRMLGELADARAMTGTLVNLVAEHCGGRLDLDERRLGALDASLGELHKVSLLEALVANDSGLTRRETAHVLLALRGYRRNLRRDAREMRHIFDEGPQHCSARVGEACGSLPAGATALEPTGSQFNPASSSSPPETRPVRQGPPSKALGKAS